MTIALHEYLAGLLVYFLAGLLVGSIGMRTGYLDRLEYAIERRGRRILRVRFWPWRIMNELARLGIYPWLSKRQKEARRFAHQVHTQGAGSIWLHRDSELWQTAMDAAEFGLHLRRVNGNDYHFELVPIHDNHGRRIPRDKLKWKDGYGWVLR